MTTTVEPIMTPERFAQGLSWEDYVASIEANKERFVKNYESFQVQPDDAAFFRRFAEKRGPVKLVAIGEDWCPDVVRGLPVAAKLAHTAGFDLRVFPRDKHLDLMNEYLWRHKYMCIPVFVFFDKDWKELGHFIERPAAAYKFMADIREGLGDDLSEEEKVKVVRQRREGVQEGWMQETVREIREQIFYRVL